MVVNLSQDQVVRFKALHDPNQDSVAELANRIFNLGLYQLEYRRKSYEGKKERMKDMRRVYNAARENPELAEKLGLGTRS